MLVLWLFNHDAKGIARRPHPSANHRKGAEMSTQGKNPLPLASACLRCSSPSMAMVETIVSLGKCRTAQVSSTPRAKFFHAFQIKAFLSAGLTISSPKAVATFSSIRLRYFHSSQKVIQAPNEVKRTSHR